MSQYNVALIIIIASISGIFSLLACELVNDTESTFYGGIFFSVPETQQAQTSTSLSQKEPEPSSTYLIESSTFSYTETGATQPSTPSSMESIPDPPTGLSNVLATSGSEGRQNFINWDLPDSEHIAYTEIRFHYVPFGEEPQPSDGYYADRIYTTENPNNTYVHSGLSNGVTYYYLVFVVDTWGQYSEIVTVSTAPYDMTPPGEISDLTIDETISGQLTLSWTNPDDWDLAGVYITKSTSAAPMTQTDGTPIATGVGNNCGDADGVIFANSAQPETWVDTVNNGETTYYRIFTFDYDCNYSFLGVATSGAAPLEPVSALKAFPGGLRVYLSWTKTDALTDHYVVRYNSTGDAMDTETDGAAAPTVDFPLDPGVVPADNTTIEIEAEDGGGPLVAGTTYYYTIFAKSAQDIVSPGRTVSIKIPSTVDVLLYDDFEGSLDFCDTWEVRDDYTNGGLHFFGPVNDPANAFDGSFYAFSTAFTEAANDCESASEAYLGTHYFEAQEAWMSYTQLPDLTSYDQVIFSYRYDYKTSYSDSHCWSGYARIRARAYVSVDDGLAPDYDDVLLGNTEVFYGYAYGWTGWRLNVVDITPYKDTDTTLAFNAYVWRDDDCGLVHISGGWRIDTVRIVGINY